MPREPSRGYSVSFLRCSRHRPFGNLFLIQNNEENWDVASVCGRGSSRGLINVVTYRRFRWRGTAGDRCRAALFRKDVSERTRRARAVLAEARRHVASGACQKVRDFGTLYCSDRGWERQCVDCPFAETCVRHSPQSASRRFRCKGSLFFAGGAERIDPFLIPPVTDRGPSTA